MDEVFNSVWEGGEKSSNPMIISIGEYIRRLEEAGNPVYLMAVWGDLASMSY